VYLADDTVQQRAIDGIVSEFSLNTEQARAFRLIANHTLQRENMPDQLLMGLFGEAGTGKSRVVEAVRMWFKQINREQELIVTATTGTAAFTIRGVILHSAVGIGIDEGERSTKISAKKTRGFVIAALPYYRRSEYHGSKAHDPAPQQALPRQIVGRSCL